MLVDDLKIAICGGGIASLCLAHALSKCRGIEVRVFEKSAVLREEGASVGLQSNALHGLAAISPELREAVDEAGGVLMDPMLRIMSTIGPDAGQEIARVPTEKLQVVVHWGPFFHALYRRVPDGILQTGKSVVNVERLHDGGCALRVHFEDGTTYNADAVIGCDGVNSVVRKTVLGADHPAASAVFVDRYNHRFLIPIEKARAVFGNEYCDVQTQTGWVGDDVFLLTDFADNGTIMQVIVDMPLKDPWPSDGPFVEWSKEAMEKSLEGYGKIGEAMTKICSEQPKLYATRLRVHRETPTFCKDRICIAGDAALTFVPFHGAGAGQAIEDALVLAAVLGTCHNPDDLVRAFEIYDSIRRPRRTQVAKLSDQAALILTGRHPDCGLDPASLSAKAQVWGIDIYDYDLVATKQKALDMMVKRRKTDRETAGHVSSGPGGYIDVDTIWARSQHQLHSPTFVRKECYS